MVVVSPSRWSRCEPRAASLETRRDNKPPNHIESKTNKTRTPYHTPPTETRHRNTLSTSRIDQKPPCIEHTGDLHWSHHTDQPLGRGP
ncbi:hypothetical protein EF294_18125 [Gordonia oryzae]|uniref:Uncharacterized protein n=1 Tax=Gordonia oryzae TaxID=2487349 RepID=A0A3N4GF55_9ACTN|nr:hypothetical protein EF294_18125 [Gordonia oryzae]